MKNKKLENNIKKSFASYKPKMDNDEIWAEIMPHLKKKKKKRAFIIWFFLMGFCVCLGGLVMGGQALFTQEENFVAQQTIISDEGNVREMPCEVPLALLDVDKSVTAKFKKKLVALSIDDKREIKPLKYKYEQVIEKEKIVTNAVAEKAIPFLAKKQFSLLRINETKEEIRWSVQNMQPDLGRKMIIKEVDYPPFVNSEEQEKKRLDFSRLSGKYYFQTNVSYILPYKSLRRNAGNGGALDNYVNKRKLTETQLEAFGIDFDLQFIDKRGWVAVAGFSYQQLNERFYQTKEVVKIENRIGILSTTENALGETIATTTGVKIVKITERDILKRYNHHRFFKATLGVGKSYKKKKGTYTYIMGINYNLNYTFEGTILAANLKPVSLKRNIFLETGYAKYFKQKTGFDLWLSAAYSRSVNPRLSWVIAPKIQIPLSYLTAVEYQLTQKYYIFSLNVGLKYLINPKK